MFFFVVNTCNLIKGLTEKTLTLACQEILRMPDNELKALALYIF